jgi:hypothetical protein
MRHRVADGQQQLSFLRHCVAHGQQLSYFHRASRQLQQPSGVASVQLTFIQLTEEA